MEQPVKWELYVWRIEQLVDNFKSIREKEQKTVKEILEKYVNGDIDINKAYNLLLYGGFLLADESTKFNSKTVAEYGKSAEREKKLKAYIENEIFILSKIKE